MITGRCSKPKYDSVCPKCGGMIEVGDDAVMLDSPTFRGEAAQPYSRRAVHDGCKDMVFEPAKPEPKQAYTIRGARKNPVCDKCYTEHPPEADCW